MKNKVYSSHFAIYFNLFSISMIFVLLSISVYLILLHPRKATVYIIGIIILLSWLRLFCFSLNRLGYRIIYDNKNKVLYRKGFIYGYFREIKIDDIKDIIVVHYPREGTYYVIVDSNNSIFDGAYKKSFLRIEKTQKSREFIEQFWNKPIKDHKKYEDLLDLVNTTEENTK